MKFIYVSLSAFLIALSACSHQPEMDAEQAEAVLSGVLNEYMDRAARENPFMAMRAGKMPQGMPDYSHTGARERAAIARSLLGEAQAIPMDKLTHQQQLTLQMLKRALEIQIEAVDHYWLSFDATPYQAGLSFSQLPNVFASFDLSEASDREAYLKLAGEVAEVLTQYRVKLEAQRERGILLPEPAIEGTLSLYRGLINTLPATLMPTKPRLQALSEKQSKTFRGRLSDTVQAEVLPALNALIAVFDESYRQAAPTRVGLSQYPGGEEAYRYLIRRETTQDLAPEVIHHRGLEYMADLRKQKAAIRQELGFEGSEVEFKEMLLADDRFYAKSPEAVEARYQRYIDLIKPKLNDFFTLTPRAGYGVKRLNPAAEASVTFGYYGAPSPGQPEGYYYYNGSKLDQRNMIWTQALIYHELVPGHHFHLALQQENDDIPAFRKYGNSITAFNEGWANYAASLADEMGIMTDPYDRYGWLLFNSFITSRLVVDTGMNAMGWTLEQARDYMYQNTFESRTQIESETIRYSTSIPAQSLAYKLGLEKIWEIRRDMEQRLGSDFDIREFHAAAVGSGSLPMPLLENHVRYELLR